MKKIKFLKKAFTYKIPKTKNIKKSWDKFSSYYENNIESKIVKKTFEIFEKQNFLKNSNLEILEIGGGSGKLAEKIFLEKEEKIDLYYFTELSPKMLESAENKLAKYKKKISFQNLNAEEIAENDYIDKNEKIDKLGDPGIINKNKKKDKNENDEIIEKKIKNIEKIDKIKKNQKFDIIISSLVLNNAENPSKIVKNLKKLLKKNGQLFISVLGPKKNCNYFSLFEEICFSHKIEKSSNFRSKHFLSKKSEIEKLFNFGDFKIFSVFKEKVFFEIKKNFAKENMNFPTNLAILKDCGEDLKLKVFEDFEERLNLFRRDGRFLEVQIDFFFCK